MKHTKRLIDGNKLSNDIALYIAENAYLNDTALDALQMVAKWIEEAPTIDAVMLPILCKQCRHWSKQSSGYCEGFGYCRLGNTYQAPTISLQFIRKENAMNKQDLITKDFALYVVHHFMSMQTWDKKDILAEIDRKIKEADEDIIRCKDCKYRDAEQCAMSFRDLYTGKLFSRESDIDFCSKGERREP